MAHQTVSHRWDVELVPTAHGRTDLPVAQCPVETAMDAVSGRWTTLVLRDLMMHGPLSFSALAEGLPTLSDKVLTDRLSELVGKGLIDRRRMPGFPSRSEYRLTERGRRLRPLLIELYRTGLALQE